MLFHNKEKQNNIPIRFTRDSVSMGDDCMAPHETEILFGATDTWIDLMNAAAKYVPPMQDCEWEVICNAEVLGTLTSGIRAGYQVEVKRRNALISALPERDIFCRKIEKIKNLTYFERLEVLYGGVYFSLNCFGEYRNVGLILEKEETKITTRDKAFASEHGFKHRELGNYDKILPINQFEGLRILRIPNDPHTKTVYIDISKDKILDELKKRVKSPHDMITDGVLAYGVDVGRLIFEEEGFTVYVISDLPHIGPSDVFMVYQISKADYEKLRLLSCPNRIPQPPVSSAVTDACKKNFLCGESAYCERYYCTLDDVDKALAERITNVQDASQQKQPEVMNYCPRCGRKNAGGKYCTECGKKLVIEYELKNIGGKVIFTCDTKEYELKSHPYEPCLYLYRNNKMVKILHNAFEVYDLVEKFEAGETISAPDSKQYDKEAFCKVLNAALCNERYEMNWTFAAKLVK